LDNTGTVIIKVIEVYYSTGNRSHQLALGQEAPQRLLRVLLHVRGLGAGVGEAEGESEV
jgi:DNA polymerase/3'-5' exonuclease PolX